MQSLVSCLEGSNIQKTFFGETRRICTPKETFEKVKKLFPVFGITRVANITGLDKLGIPVYVACRPNSRSLSTAQGKGCTHDAARTSAIMESIESYHAETIHLPLKLCSHNELHFKNNCIDVARLPRFENSLFTTDHRILWIEGVDLFTRLPKWVPFESVHVDYRDPLPPGHGCFVSSSNGLSSGNNYHESLIHGLCEVIERDALTLWSLKPPQQQLAEKIALNTVDDPRIINILERYAAAEIDVGIWDITSNIGIPAFLCKLLPRIEPEMSGIRLSSGMGCHLSKEIALLRAVTEAAQSRLTFISGTRDDMKRDDYAKYLSAKEYSEWRNAISPAGRKDYKKIANVEQPTFDGDLAFLLEALHKQGISEAVAVDLAKEEFGIPVTRVVVPGLESYLSSKGSMLGERAGRILYPEGQA